MNANFELDCHLLCVGDCEVLGRDLVFARLSSEAILGNSVITPQRSVHYSNIAQG
jgi:hypothetical protein